MQFDNSKSELIYYEKGKNPLDNSIILSNNTPLTIKKRYSKRKESISVNSERAISKLYFLTRYKKS